MTFADADLPENDGGDRATHGDTNVAAQVEETKFKDISGWKILGFAVGGLALITVIVWIVWLLIGSPDKPTEWVDTLGRSAALIVAAIVALPAAYITFKRQQGLEHQTAIERNKHQHDQAKELQRQREAQESAERERARAAHDATRETNRLEEVAAQINRDQLRDLQGRFVTAARMLGDDKAAVRIAGVTAIATLADDWFNQADTGIEQAQACIDVLCDYLRQPHPMVDIRDAGDVRNAADHPAADPEEAIVRENIIRVIRSRLLPGARHPWTAFSFDFSRTTFAYRVNLRGVKLGGSVSFERSTFHEDADFTGSTLAGGSAFESATFTGEVNFTGARFSGEVSFVDALFANRAFFGDAAFAGFVSFQGATFEEGPVNLGAVFNENASFAFTRFAGRADFGDAKFSKSANFDYARFDDHAEFGGDPRFGGGTTFHGAAGFWGASFGGTVSFAHAVFAGTAELATPADFRSATFNGDADFECTTLAIGASFEDASIGGRARFDRASIRGHLFLDSAAVSLTPSPHMTFEDIDVDPIATQILLSPGLAASGRVTMNGQPFFGYPEGRTG